MKLFVLTTLFPNSAYPLTGLFVSRRLEALKKFDETIDITVCAPVPYFPLAGLLSKEYQKKSAISPASYGKNGLKILHPRFLNIPLFGAASAPGNLAKTAHRVLKEYIQKNGKPDILAAEYFYPDAPALAALSSEFNIPFVATGRGSDITHFRENPVCCEKIVAAGKKGAAFAAMSDDLKNDMIKTGLPAEKIYVIRNGVDTDLFKPTPSDIRQQLGVKTKKVVLSVGHLVERKGHHLLIEALQDLPDVSAIIVGEGEARALCERVIKKHQLADRVFLVGAKPPESLPLYYSAADLFVLLSAREGRANVLGEAAACGVPLCSTNVQGASEFISNETGIIVPERTPEIAARTIQKALEKTYNRETIRASVADQSWTGTAKHYADFLRSAVKTSLNHSDG